jgi:hypothetical protein
MIPSGRRFGTPIAIGTLSLWMGLAAPIHSAAADSSQPAAVAEEPAPIARPPAGARQSEHIAYWRARADQARADVAAARQRLDEANAAVARMNARNHPRGEARVALRQEQAAAREAHEAAVRALEVDLPAEARSAGVSPSWFQAGR